ncbi:deoxyhypusine synthase [Candidatus Woesearchaeota archaeon]|nr:deoxyhypusine synthase [Candidatus Woesearchaeota archaeon]
MKEVKDISPDKLTANELVKQLYESGGFVAKKLATGVNILEKMTKDEKCIKFLSFPACIISTGTRGVIKDLVKNKSVDVLITTCGTLDHDLARIWKPYWHGAFEADDKELHKKGIYRLGNIFIPKESYGEILENKIQPVLKNMYENKKELSGKEFIWELGKALENEENKESSIIYWAWKNKIPVFVPGITDGAVGSQLWLFRQKHSDFKIDLLADENDLSNIVFDAQIKQSSTGPRKTNGFSRAKKLGALMLGGGISKHHTIWWAQFGHGLDYAVYITTAVEWDGSLSGAETKEAISWGKIKEQGMHITINGDITILLPLMISALKERLGG